MNVNISLNKLPPLTENQYLNLLAIDVLEKTGNNAPSQAEIDAAESFFIQLRQQYKDMPFASVIGKIREAFMKHAGN